MHKKNAFSTLEVVISLMIVALIAMSFVPIITKKLTKSIMIPKRSSNVSKGQLIITPDSKGREEKYFKCNGELTTSLEDAKSLNCIIRNIPSDIINVAISGAGGGGAGAIKTEFTPMTKEYQAGIADNSFEITEHIKNLKVNLYGASGGGGGGLYTYKLNEITCPAGTIRIGYMCVTQTNVSPVPQSTSSLKESLSTTSRANECCYVNVSTGAYKKRTVCSFSAAHELCSNFSAGNLNDWSLPSVYEIIDGPDFVSGGFASAHSSLMLCGLMGSSISCSLTYSCHDFNDISLTFTGDASQHAAKNWEAPGYDICLVQFRDNRFEGNWTDCTNDITKAQKKISTRCIWRMLRLIAVAGGGGGGGSASLNIKVPDDILSKCTRENLKCRLNVRPGLGGAGGSGRTGYRGTGECTKSKTYHYNCIPEQAGNGEPGEETVAEIITQDNRVLWGYKVFGAQGGIGASKDGAGNGGSYGLCQINDGFGYRKIDCQYPGEHGNKGSGTALGTDELQGLPPDATGGKRGIYGTNYKNDYTEDDEEFYYGSGGSIYVSKFRKIPYSDKEVEEAEQSAIGKKGFDGYISIAYDYIHGGASGGGGGGGAFGNIKNIKVIAKKEYNIKLGLGGNGGMMESAGLKGGDTIVEFENGAVYKASGGQGGQIGNIQVDSMLRTSGAGGEAGNFVGTSIFESATKHNGENGKNGYTTPDSIKAIGGSGGRSGISMISNIIQNAIACGGLYNNSNDYCFNHNIDGYGAYDLNYHNSEINPAKNKFGSYGAGGGGGGWDFANGAEKIGKGGDGQDGYIYIWW